jgi:hypothetical protein
MRHRRCRRDAGRVLFEQLSGPRSDLRRAVAGSNRCPKGQGVGRLSCDKFQSGDVLAEETRHTADACRMFSRFLKSLSSTLAPCQVSPRADPNRATAAIAIVSTAGTRSL